MTADPLSKESALARVKRAGVGAGKFGTPADRNPYKGKASMTEEFSAWESGRQIGAADKKRGAK